MSIGLPELQFLLEDLSLKLSHALITTAVKRRSFLKTSANKGAGFSSLERHSAEEVARRAVDLLPHLLAHVEDACAFYQVRICQ